MNRGRDDYDTTNEEWGLSLATSGDRYLATDGDFLMAADTTRSKVRPQVIATHPASLNSSLIGLVIRY